jgi:hypothetical protein
MGDDHSRGGNHRRTGVLGVAEVTRPITVLHRYTRGSGRRRMLLWSKALALEAGSDSARDEWAWWVERLAWAVE